MPKLIIPRTTDDPGTIEMREYGEGNPRHLRALSRYLFNHVHGNTVISLVRALIPGLEEEQVANIVYTRLKNLAQMDLTQAEEIFYKKGEEE